MIKILIKLWTWKHILIGWLIPIIFLPILFYYSFTKESKCAYVVLMMISYWYTEVIPMAITALIPLVMFPLFGILSSDQVTESYIDESIMILLGSLIAASAVEKSNLHERIALRIALLTGSSLKRLLLGFMFATAFLSMLVNGIASVALMIPIVNAAVDKINAPKSKTNSLLNASPATTNLLINGIHEQHDEDDQANGTMKCPDLSSTLNIDKSNSLALLIENDGHQHCHSNDYPSINTILNITTSNPESDKLTNAIFLSVCYAANIGSIGTLTGTPVNLVLNAFLKDDSISYSQWFLMNFPMAIMLILFAWWFLSYFMINSNTYSRVEVDRINLAIQIQYEKLGALTFQEFSVLILFGMLVVLWFFRAPDFMIGWSTLITDRPQYIKDSFPTMIIVILFFLIPANPADLANSPMLLDWKSAQQHVSWSILLLLGGGYAMAHGFTKSGLSQLLGDKLLVLDNLPHTLITLIMCLAALLLTELISNTATCSILLPVVFQVTTSAGISPLSVVLPVTISCSFAFMFPFSSGPTAIIYEASGMKNTDMIIPGTFVKLICLVGLIAINHLFWNTLFFQ